MSREIAAGERDGASRGFGDRARNVAVVRDCDSTDTASVLSPASILNVSSALTRCHSSPADALAALFPSGPFERRLVDCWYASLVVGPTAPP